MDKVNTAYIAIGANLGKPAQQCLDAAERIKKIPQTVLVRLSSLYSSKPLVPEGKSAKDIPPYVNSVCEIKTALSPNMLLDHLKKIEREMGRKQREKWASREIDLDLLFFDQEIIQWNTLTIPHPELHLRGFVVKPMAEIAPGWIHPVLGKTIAQLMENLDDASDVGRV